MSNLNPRFEQEDGSGGRPIATRLPAGHHGLPRRVVARDQRERLIDGVTYAVSELGYANTTVADITLFARVSRRTFYEHFADKEECFLAAYDAGMARLVRTVRAAQRDDESSIERMRAGIAAFVELIADEPGLARLCLVEVVAAGPRALERRDCATRGFCAGMLELGLQHVPEGVEIPPTAAELVIGGLQQIVHARLTTGDAQSLLDELPEIVYCALVPFCGHEQARALADDLVQPSYTKTFLTADEG